LIFHALVPLQSGKNTANYSRCSLCLIYNQALAGDLKAGYYDSYVARTGGGEKFFR